MAPLTERLTQLRRRHAVIDHAVRAGQHYGAAKGTIQAGAVTYFGFLSVFPIMALAFFAVGWASQVFPEADDTLVTAIQDVLPGLISTDGTPAAGEIELDDIQSAAATVGLIGLVGVLYTGLGWLSAMREALVATFETPERRQPGFVVGKLRDLVSLLLVGVTLMLTVSVSGVATTVSGGVLDTLGRGSELEWLVVVVGIVVGLGANTLLFFALFRLLANPPIPSVSLWKGAAFGAVGFEVLKQVSALVISSITGNPAFAVFGSALVLLVWINYTARVVVLSASWAHEAPAARARREREARDTERHEMEMRELAAVQLRELPPSRRLGAGTAYAAGGVSMLGLVALVRRWKGEGP